MNKLQTNLKSESVETVKPYMVTYRVPLLPSPPFREGEDPVRTSHNNPSKKKCES